MKITYKATLYSVIRIIKEDGECWCTTVHRAVRRIAAVGKYRNSKGLRIRKRDLCYGQYPLHEFTHMDPYRPIVK